MKRKIFIKEKLRSLVLIARNETNYSVIILNSLLKLWAPEGTYFPLTHKRHPITQKF